MIKQVLAALAVAASIFSLPARAEPAGENAMNVATFAAGCYWCVESDFDKVKGVLSTESGFMGGTVKNPTYKDVSTGTTGHLEVVRVTFDPKVVTYDALLAHFWVNVDPLDGTGQFCDRGSHYRPAIFTYGDEQKRAAEESLKKVARAKNFKSAIVVEILPASAFTAAHDQDFYKTNSLRYKYYRAGCGRDARLNQLWGEAPAY